MVRRLALLLLLAAVLVSADEDEWDAADLAEAAAALWNAAEALASFLAHAQQVGAGTALLHAAVASVVLIGVYQAFRSYLEAAARDKRYQPYRVALHAASAYTQRSSRDS